MVCFSVVLFVLFCLEYLRPSSSFIFPTGGESKKITSPKLLTPYRCYFEYRIGTTPTFPGPSPVSCWILTSLLRKIMRMMWASLGLGNDQGQLFAERGSSRGPLVPGEVFSMQERAKREGQGLGTVFSRRILQRPEL